MFVKVDGSCLQPRVACAPIDLRCGSRQGGKWVTRGVSSRSPRRACDGTVPCPAAL